MAAPRYITESTGSTDATGPWTHTAAAPAAVGNVLIVQVLQDGVAASPTIDSVTNAEALDGTDNTLTFIGEFNIGSAVVASQHLWIGRATSTSAMVITGGNAGGDDVYIRVYEFDNVSTGTTLATVIENGTAGGTANEAATSGTIADAGVTTLGPDRMALNFVGINDDNAITTLAGASEGDWVDGPLSEYAEAGGTDATIMLYLAWPGLAANASQLTSQFPVFGSTGTEEAQAQSFSSGAGGSMVSVLLHLTRAASPTDDLTIELRDDSGGNPGSTVIASATVSCASLPSSENYRRPITVPMVATLAASTTYWLMFTRTGARDTSNYPRVTGPTSANTYANGQRKRRDSGSWVAESSDITFSIQVTAGAAINGGTVTNPDATDGWGNCGFALIGTTAAGPTSSFLIPRATWPSVLAQR